MLRYRGISEFMLNDKLADFPRDESLSKTHVSRDRTFPNRFQAKPALPESATSRMSG